jgi:hypothetical protein
MTYFQISIVLCLRTDRSACLSGDFGSFRLRSITTAQSPKDRPQRNDTNDTLNQITDKH